MAENIIELIISAKDMSGQAIQRLQEGLDGLKTSTQKAAEHTEGITAGFTRVMQAAKLAASALAAYSLSSIFKETIEAAARVETLGVVLETVGKNAGYSKTDIYELSKSVEQMGITTAESHQTIIKMAQAQLDLKKASELARVAQDAAVIGQINSSEALNRLLHGITTLQPEIMRNIGITVSLEEEYRKFAKTANRSVESLTSQEKQQIALNAVLREGQKITGAYEASLNTVGKMMGSLARFIEQAAVAVGKMFLPAMKTITKEITSAFKSIQSYFSTLEKTGKLEQISQAINAAVRAIISVFSALTGAIKFLVTNIDTILVASLAFLIIKLNALAISLVNLPFAAAALGAFKLAGGLTSVTAAAGAALGILQAFAPVLAAIAAYQIGKWLDSWIYKLANIDISGVNRLNEAMEWVEENQRVIAEKAKVQAETLKRLGFEGADAYVKFNQAVKDGLVIYDQTAGAWVNIRKNIDGTTQVLQASEEQISKTNQKMQDMINIVTGLYESTMKLSGEQLKTAMTDQNASISMMRKSLANYQTVVTQVFSAKIDIISKAKDIMSKYGAASHDIAAANVKILEAEKSKLSELLTAWEAYYSRIKTLHQLATDALKESAAIEFDLKKQLMTASEAYYANVKKLEEDFQKAIKLSGEEKIKALQAFQREAAASAKAVEEGGNIIIDKETAINKALKMVQAASEELRKEHDAAGDEMKEVGKTIDDYRRSLESLDIELRKEKTLAININQALSAVQEVKRAIDSIPDITYKKVVIQMEGEGSTRKPITEKIAEVQSKLGGLSAKGSYKMEFTSDGKSFSTDTEEKLIAIERLKQKLKELQAVYNRIMTSSFSLTPRSELEKLRLDIRETENEIKKLLNNMPKTITKINETIGDFTNRTIKNIENTARKAMTTIIGLGKMTDEKLSAKKLLADITGDAATALLIAKSEQLQELQDYYKKGLLTAEEYQKGVNAINDNMLTELKKNLEEGKITQEEYEKARLNLSKHINDEMRKAQEDSITKQLDAFQKAKEMTEIFTKQIKQAFSELKILGEFGAQDDKTIALKKDMNVNNIFQLQTFDEQTTRRWLHNTVFPEWERLMKLRGTI